MKKITLFAAVAMMAGTSFAQNGPEELNGLKISYGSDTAQFHFYRMRNMRAMRMDYTNGTIRNHEGDSINKDGGGFFMSPTLVDGVTPTPQISDRPYMGLSQLDGNWWLSFSNQEEIKHPDTEYWWFEWGGKSADKTVKIHNAVIDGAVSDTAHKAKDLAGYNRSNMDFNLKTRGNRYYVLPVRPAFDKMYEETGVNWTDSILKRGLTEAELNMAFALCLEDTITADAGDCLDMNNYINIKQYPAILDENKDTVRDENGYVEHYRYGFAGVDRTWTPITTTSNNNHWENNGTLFFVEEASAEEAMAAIDRYKKVIAEGYRQGADEGGKSQFQSAVQTIKGWLNVPAAWADQTRLREILASCESWAGEGLDLESVKDADTREKYIEAAKNLADKKLAEAASLVGNGCKVRFKNMLALRDLDTYNQQTANPDLQLGCAYLCVGGNITYRDGGTVEEIYDDDALIGMGIRPLLEPDDEDSTWELQWIPGKPQFRLYNEASGTYIRKYHDMFEYCGGEEYIPSSASEFSWATTHDVEDAAPFQLIGCANPDEQTPLTPEQEEALGYAEMNTDVENKVRLTSNYTETAVSDAGVPTTTEYTFNIHRGSVGSDYKFINWGYTVDNWFADSNAFEVEQVEVGSIDEIGADSKVKAHGIYDLQGRRVAKAGKGIYIIDGKKTFVR